MVNASTGNSLSEAPIFAPTNPQYDNKLFIELWVQHMKKCNLRTCTELVIQNNLLSYCGLVQGQATFSCPWLVDARISAAEKDTPVLVNA